MSDLWVGRGPVQLALRLDRGRRCHARRRRRGRRTNRRGGRGALVIVPAIKRDHDDLHERLDRDVRGRCGGAFLLCLCGRVDAHVSSQFVRARETLLASSEGALVRAFPGVRSDVASLVLQTMEGLWADVAFVRARSILATPGC